MQTILFITALLLPSASVAPADSAGAIEVNRATAYSATDGFAFEAEGPGALLFDIYGDKSMRGKTASVEIKRDQRFVSANEIKLKKKGGSKDYPAKGSVGVNVPEGKHTYLIKTDGPVIVAASVVKKIKSRMMAATEVEVEPEPSTELASGDDVGSERSVEELTAMGESAATSVVSAEGDVAPSTAPLRAAVYDLKLEGIEKNIGSVVTDSLLAEVRKLQGISAIGMDEIRDMLSHETNKQIMGCDSSEECLAEIAGALGVDVVITGSLSKVGDGHVINLRRINQEQAKVEGVFNQRLKAGSGQEFLLSVGPAIEQLFPERALRSGTERGVAKEVALRLDPPPLPPIAFTVLPEPRQYPHLGLVYSAYWPASQSRITLKQSPGERVGTRSWDHRWLQRRIERWAMLFAPMLVGA